MIDAYHVYLNASEVLVRRQTGWGRWRRIEELGRWPWDAAVPASLHFDALVLRPRRHATLCVYAGSALGKFMVIELPAGLHGAMEERAVAQAQMQLQLGLQPGLWDYALDRVPGAGKAVACALRADIGLRLRQLAGQRGMRLLSLRPYAACAWNAMQSPLAPAEAAGLEAGVLMLVEQDAFTIFTQNDGVIDAVSALAHRREADLVNREVRRLAYALGDDAQRRIRLALTADLAPLAHLHADKIVQRDDYLDSPLYADFRDLLFQVPVQAQVQVTA